ncbi:MAG: HepT-like ribonuclease domain-containing protein [Tepidiformaceae bacterium]
MRDDRARLLDIIEAATRIEKYTVFGRDRFDVDELVQNWIVHHLQIVGEACSQLSAELRDQHAEIPWRGFVGMRNILVHQYFGIDLEPVWLAATSELEVLSSVVHEMLVELDNRDGRT